MYRKTVPLGSIYTLTYYAAACLFARASLILPQAYLIRNSCVRHKSGGHTPSASTPLGGAAHRESEVCRAGANTMTQQDVWATHKRPPFHLLFKADAPKVMSHITLSKKRRE